MNHNNSKALFLSIFMMFLMISAHGQNRYLHLTGSIENEEKVSADLVITGEKIYGFIQNHFTREAPLRVTGSLLDGGIINLIDKTTDIEFITATMSENDLITGKWKDFAGEERPFEMSVIYPEGSHKFGVTAVSSMQSLIDSPDSPMAVFESCILTPSNSLNKAFNDSFMTLVYKDLFKSNNASDPNVMLKSHESAFFDQYRVNNTDINTKENYQYLNWEKRKILSVVFNESDLVSLNFQDYTYTGGTSGLEMNKYLVFDFTKGNKIGIYDILQKEKENTLSELIKSEICRKLNIDPSGQLTDNGFFSNDVFVTSNFCLTSYGIVFHYNTYELAGQETGPLSVYLPFNNLTEVLISEGITARIVVK
jgi:hypothetical protein